MWKSTHPLPLDWMLSELNPPKIWSLIYLTLTVDAQVQSPDSQIPLEQFPACRQLKSAGSIVFGIHIPSLHIYVSFMNCTQQGFSFEYHR